MGAGFVYILKSKKSGQYYIGSTLNISKRLKEHNSGQTASTRNKGPWELVFEQKYPSIAEAQEIELGLKKLKRRDYIDTIIREKFIRMGLA